MKTKLIMLAVLLVFAVSGGCASKPKAIQAGAASFSAESLKSIDMLDELVVREVKDTLSETNSTQIFVNQALHPDTKLNRDSISRLIHPFASRDESVKAAWKEYIKGLRAFYTEYGQMFNSLDKGSLFSSKQIQESIPITKKLTANMIALSRHWEEHPAHFNTDFVTLTTQLDGNRKGASSEEVKKLKAVMLYKTLDDLFAAEHTMTQALVAQSYKAALLGQCLTKLLEDYDKLTVDDISESLTKMFQLAAYIPGLDLGNYQTKTEDFIKKLNEDAASKEFLNTALGSLNTTQK